MNVFMVWLQFLISAALVIVGGFYLARNGKELGERHGLSDLWVGFIFLAAVTSIPELATALGAVLIAHSPSLALSDILGSNAFNLFIIFVISVCLARRPITADLSLAPFRLLLLMIILMTGLLMVFAALNRNRQLLSPGGISLASWAVAILYLAGSWKLFRDELPPGAIRKKKEKGDARPGHRDALYYRLLASVALVVVGGFWLARTGQQIAELTHWGESFVGALFLALVTSLPEVAVCLAAVRMGANEMALGNILGSNIFNLGIVFWADLAYRKGSILGGIGPAFYVAGGMGIVLVLVTALWLRMKPEPAARFAVWNNVAIAVIYLAGMYWLFHLSAG
ncbi:MAG: hypothetical protein RAO92_03285 [Candidatus Euphemobacter frigidus]|nr:hypothetical protein [Candidatus Euphemobacter frigidus]MDP8275404.1 hypothetical protein [Candidatus Euphemobacter frigidus]